MISVSLFIISSYLTAATSLIMGFFVIFNWRLKENRLWFLTTLAIFIWSFSLATELSSPNYQTAFFWNKILNLGAIFIPPFFYHFITSFLQRDRVKTEKFFISLAYILSIMLVYCNFFTNQFVKGVPPKAGFNYWVEVGILYYPFFIFFALIMIRIVYLLLRYRHEYPLLKKQQVNYLLVATFLGIGGGITNFFPQLFNIYPFGNFFVALYAIFITYAILRHHLFNIKVIMTELFTFALCLVFLVKTFLSITTQEIVFNVSILIFVIFMGILLIKSVLNEVKHREQMEKMAREVAQAYEVERKAREELEKLDKYKDNYLMQVQHDLRSPFSVLMGYTDLLLENAYGRIPKEAREVLKKMQDVLTDKVRDINNFLDVKQFKLGKGVVSIKPGVNLVSLIEKIVETLFPKTNTSDKKIYLKFEKEGDNFIISADEEKLKSAIFNIVDNGIKYTKEGGVTIRLKRLEDRIRIEIQDTGIGISEEKKKTIFEAPFERTLEAQKMAGGSGVGLYLSSEIIKAHNGKIWAESKGEGLGSTFFIELPVS